MSTEGYIYVAGKVSSGREGVYDLLPAHLLRPMPCITLPFPHKTLEGKKGRGTHSQLTTNFITNFITKKSKKFHCCDLSNVRQGSSK